jgi:ribonuclease BN (tRNA processing enzyme)
VSDQPVELVLVGTGDAFGNGGRFQTCFVLRHGDDAVMVDCGASSLTALKAAGLEPNDIEVVVLTHLHGDHFGGLPFLILDGQLRRRERPLTIAGPPGTTERLHRAMDVLFPGSRSAPRRFEITVVELDFDAPTRLGPAVVRTLKVEQPDTPACALRVQLAGKVMVYTGDTAWTDGLIELAAGADVLVAESYFYDREVPYHLSYPALVENRDRLDCRRILLTHMSPQMLDRQGDALFECAHDGMVVRL